MNARFWGAYVVIASFIVAAIGAGASFSLRAQQQLLAARARERAVAEVGVVAASLRPFVAGGQIDAARAAFNQMVREHPSILSAIFANESGKVLFQSGVTRPAQRVLDLIPPPVQPVARPILGDGETRALEVTLPLSLPEKREGALRAEVRLLGLEPDLLAIAVPFAGAAVALLAAGALAALVVGRRTRPAASVRYTNVRPLVVAPDLRARANAANDARREAAVEAARAKSAFLMAMSRELRAPVERLVEHTRALASELSGEQRQRADAALATSEGLLTLTSRIDDYLSVEAGTFDDADHDMDPYLLVGDLVEIFAPIAHRKRVELVWWIEPEVPALLHGPARRVREVLAKLVSNALRFTDSGEVCVTVSRDGNQRGRAVMIRFAVSDTGCGIEPSRRRGLFTLAGDGSGGLGLLTCKQLVDSMRGSISCAGREQRGSTFTFVVPLLAQPRPADILPHDEGALRSQRIMIVDDNATSRSVLKRELASWTIPHEAVAGGREALTRLRAAVDYGAPYALVIVDALMPEMTGVDLARAIRNEPKLAELPILLLTTDDHPGAAVLEELRVNATLAKPVRPGRLYTCLAAILLAHMKGTARVPTAA